MKLSDPAPLRTRPDGSIDTAYYMALGRQARSDQARDMTRDLAKAATGAVAGASVVPPRGFFARVFGWVRATTA